MAAWVATSACAFTKSVTGWIGSMRPDAGFLSEFEIAPLTPEYRAAYMAAESAGLDAEVARLELEAHQRLYATVPGPG